MLSSFKSSTTDLGFSQRLAHLPSLDALTCTKIYIKKLTLNTIFISLPLPLTVKWKQQKRQNGRESCTYSEKTKSDDTHVKCGSEHHDSKEKQRDSHDKRGYCHHRGQGSQIKHSAHWSRISDSDNRQKEAKRVNSETNKMVHRANMLL